MKKVSLVILLVALLISGSAGGYQTDEVEQIAGESFAIDVINNCTDDIYGFHYEYYLQGNAVGGGDVVIADSVKTPFPVGDSSLFSFSSADFPPNAGLASFQLELFVVGKDSTEMKVEPLLELAAQYGERYQFELTGNYSDGFTIAPLID